MKKDEPRADIPPASDAGLEAGEGAQDRSLLIVDDDQIFLARLGKAMEARGYVVTSETSVAGGLAAIAKAPGFCRH